MSEGPILRLARRARSVWQSHPRRTAVVFIVIVLCGWALLGPGGRGGPAETASVHREDLVITVEATGELDAVRSSLIGPPPIPSVWEFKIASMAPESSVVRMGDPILSFDTASLQDELQRREVEHEVAVKDLEKKEAELALALRDLALQLTEAESRLQKAALKADSPEDLAGVIDLQVARLDRDLAEREVASLRRRVEARRRAAEAERESLARKRDHAASRVRELQDSIARMSITAPQDGIVVYQADRQGEKKEVGDSVWASEKIMKIPDLAEMMGRGEVDEAEAGRLTGGQPVTVRLDALPDAEYTGRLESIGGAVRQRSRDNPQKIYTVEIALDRTDPERMRPGMRLRAEIEVDRAPDALVVPRDAVFLRESGPVVLARSFGRFVERPVTIGRRNGRLVEILGGVSEGTLVARRDLSRVEEGAGS